MTDRPDVQAIACAAGRFDPASFEAGCRFTANAQLLADLPAHRAQARVTTLRALHQALQMVADAIGYAVWEESDLDPDSPPCADSAAVSLVFTPKGLR